MPHRSTPASPQPRPEYPDLNGQRLNPASNRRPAHNEADQARSAILLVAGDKSGNWKQWYREAIPRAEHLLEVYLKERAEEEGGS